MMGWQSAATGRAGRSWRGLVLGLAASVGLGACATKKDVKLLRDEVLRLQVRQDSLFREMQRQNRLLLDTLRVSFDIQRDAQGQTSHRFQQLEQQLDRTEELVNQLLAQLAQVTARLDQQASRPAAGVVASGGETGGAQVEQIYQMAMDQMGLGAYTTARTAFASIVNQFPNDARAPDAQYQVAQSYAAEGDFASAITEFEKVEARWSSSPRAPEALLQAGVLAEEHAQKDRARRYYQQVRERYPSWAGPRAGGRRLAALRG